MKMKYLKLSNIIWFFFPCLLCGCKTVKSGVGQSINSQSVIYYTYIIDQHEFKDSYVYEAMAGDSAIIIIQPKERCRRVVCYPQTYYSLMLEEIHNFRIPSGLSFGRISEIPYTIMHRKKVVYTNGWLGEKTNYPIFLLKEIK